MCLWLSVQICSVCNAFAAKAPNMLAQRADLIMSVFLKLVIREEMLVYQALQKHIWALWALYITYMCASEHDSGVKYVSALELPAQKSTCAFPLSLVEILM